jgi:phosphatidylglycerophosphatase A
MKLEKTTSGWGVMADDFMAGIYADFILQLPTKLQDVILLR